VAEIAFPQASVIVVGMVGNMVLGMRRSRPADQLLGDDAAGILAANDLVNHIAVEK